MPLQECTVCKHPDVEALNEVLRSGSQTFRALAIQTGLTAASLYRHKQHVAPAKGHALKDIGAEIMKLRHAQARAKRKGNTNEALAISREIRAWLALEAKADAAAAAAGKRREESTLSRAEALQAAMAIVEAQLAAGDKNVFEWLTGVFERAVATFSATGAGAATDKAIPISSRHLVHDQNQEEEQ